MFIARSVVFMGVCAWGAIARAAPDEGVKPHLRSYEGPLEAAWVEEEASPAPPPPRLTLEQTTATTIDVAVGLAPEAPGSRDERALLDRLQVSVAASKDPRVQVRRLRPGVGSPRSVCRERQDDFVIMIGYVADRPDPVVLAHDCRLDAAFDVRDKAAADEPGLVAVLWHEHEAWIRAGARERRMPGVLGRKARIGIIAGVALVVVGVAVGVLIANQLRDETVVLRVRP